MHILTVGLTDRVTGGIESYIMAMVRTVSTDYVFDHVVVGHKCNRQDEIASHGGKVFYTAEKHNLIKNVLDWTRILKEGKGRIDAVYFNLFSLSWITPIILARRYGYPVVVHAHNNNLHKCSSLVKIMHSINRKLQRNWKICRLTNSELSSVFMFGNAECAKTIYNAIDTERFSFNASKREDLRKELSIEDKNVYGFSGRLSFQKNPLFLAFALLGRQLAVRHTKRFAAACIPMKN